LDERVRRAAGSLDSKGVIVWEFLKQKREACMPPRNLRTWFERKLKDAKIKVLHAVVALFEQRPIGPRTGAEPVS
jgi:hypothetical protein